MKIKVCGMKYSKNILDVAALRPDYMGFIFWKPSARFIDGSIPDNIPNSIKKTGVFVDASQNDIIDIVKTRQLNALQLHGEESSKFCASLKRELIEIKNCPVEIIKAFSIGNSFDFNTLQAYETSCDFYLFDTKGRLPGGNGFTFDWSVLENYPSNKPYFLSGGIGTDSVQEIKNFIKEPMSKYCYAIDLNSKFETAPGLKNQKLLNAFFNSIRKQKMEL